MAPPATASAPTPNPHPDPQERVKGLLGNQQLPSKAIRHADSSLRKMEEREGEQGHHLAVSPLRRLYSHGIWAAISPSTFAPIHFVSLAPPAG